MFSHFYDPYTHLHLNETIEENSEAPDSAMDTIRRIDRRFPLKLRFSIAIDLERTLSTKRIEFVKFFKKKMGDTSPRIPQPNDGSERSGQLTMEDGSALKFLFTSRSDEDPSALDNITNKLVLAKPDQDPELNTRNWLMTHVINN